MPYATIEGEEFLFFLSTLERREQHGINKTFFSFTVHLLWQAPIFTLSSQLSSGLHKLVPAGCHNQSLETKERSQDMRAHVGAKQIVYN